MEVLNASAPGARVHVVRAAYHSSSGPGAPASSYMMHSSRRVISSGTRLLSPSLTSRPFGDTPSLPSLPMEISSTPLDLLPDTPETENYKVTEPDDTEISEPSKWKSSTGKNSIRMPSEESSSTDNASIIDLDSKTNHKSIFRKYSYDSENSDIPSMKLGSRASPLLDAPATLSTLKYKSLLNGSDDWNNRRKSYSFEETSPLSESISHFNGTLAMESSTDSGICKSSELVNDHSDYEKRDRQNVTHEDSFKDWLNKNRQTSFNKNNQFKSHREHNVVIEEPSESNITLQSKGKVSITVPITLETDDDYQYKKAHVSEEVDRKIKKVEFCKTELHFAAESGRVNIIATDEKPPPTNDFRRKKSAFMPITNKPERPITLFGDKKNIESDIKNDFYNTSDMGEYDDENTAATKSILKNKIPKPKPYLLGENMAFGLNDVQSNIINPSMNHENADVPTAVSLINRQLQTERRHSNDTSSLSSETDSTTLKKIVSRPISTGLTTSVSSKHREVNHSSESEVTSTFNSVKNKLKALQMSPVPARAKTRQLRQSDLTYFGIQNDKKKELEDKPKFIRDRIKMQNDAIDNIFQSVRLIQQVSSLCNSEAESEDAVEYQNVPFKTNFAPVPTPRQRTKYTDKVEDPGKITILKPIIEQDSAIITKNTQDTRRSRSRKYEEVSTSTLRSISEPPKANRINSMEKSRRRHNHVRQHNITTRANNYESRDNKYTGNCSTETAKLYLSDEEEETVPIYVNVNKGVIDDNNVEMSDKNIRKPDKKKTVHKPENLDISCSAEQSSDYPAITDSRKATQRNKRKDENVNSITKQGGSHTRTEKKPSEVILEQIINTHENKITKESQGSGEVLKPHHTRNSSRHLTVKKDSLEHQKRSSINSADRHRKSLQIKTDEKNGEIRLTKERPRSKRNEYVINYDDKNGTVTSVCKVSADQGSTKKKKSSLEKLKEIKSQNKTPEKINLRNFQIEKGIQADSVTRIRDRRLKSGENTVRKPLSESEWFVRMTDIPFCAASNGSVLVGCSELTGRYWSGGAAVFRSISEAQEINPKSMRSIQLDYGSADGCFVGSSSKWKDEATVAEHDSMIMAVDCLEAEKQYVTAGADSHIKVWDLSDMICIRNYSLAHSATVSDVSVRPKSTTSFASGSLDIMIVVFAVYNGLMKTNWCMATMQGCSGSWMRDSQKPLPLCYWKNSSML
ncbi:hypothetical protein MSG28_003494 [Choristoneura fumiferana]|uniref:Uncharacterized protein n=1 Tax=Choristoneura fumiferana TaxID=7141 RepID=A0ACC0KF67_CHOFU|nr:hypothetical protein MSG28_003494 [Choristoneura fumiferana]